MNEDAWIVDENNESTEGEPREELSFGKSTVLDLSGFSLEERTLLHLRAAGLIDDIRPFAKQMPLTEKDDESTVKNGRQKGTESPQCWIVLFMRRQTRMISILSF